MLEKEINQEGLKQMQGCCKEDQIEIIETSIIAYSFPSINIHRNEEMEVKNC